MTKKELMRKLKNAMALDDWRTIDDIADYLSKSVVLTREHAEIARTGVELLIKNLDDATASDDVWGQHAIDARENVLREIDRQLEGK